METTGAPQDDRPDDNKVIPKVNVKVDAKIDEEVSETIDEKTPDKPESTESGRGSLRPGTGKRSAGPWLAFIPLLVAMGGIALLLLRAAHPMYQTFVTLGIGPKHTAISISYPENLYADVSGAGPVEPNAFGSIALIPRGGGQLQQFVDNYILRKPAAQRVTRPITVQYMLLDQEKNQDAEIERFREAMGGSLRRGETFEIRRRSFPSGPALEFAIQSRTGGGQWIVLYPPAGANSDPVEVVVRYMSPYPIPAGLLREIDDVVSRIKLVERK